MRPGSPTTPRIITLAAITAALTALTACSPAAPPTQSALPTSWVASSAEDAMITQWTQTAGTVTGTLDEAYKTTTTTPAEFTTRHISIHGTIADGNITLTADSGTSFTGTINATTLHLSFPNKTGLTQLDLRPGSPDDYNKASADVRTGIMKSAEKAAGVQARSDAATALKQYQDSLGALKTASDAAATSQAAAGPARDTVLAAKRTFLDYSNKVLAGACWNDAQFAQVKALYDAISAAYDPAVSQLETLRKATKDLGDALSSAGAANAAAVAANSRLLATDQVKIPDDGGAVADGRAALDRDTTARASMQGEIDAALRDTEKVINGFPTNKYCS